MFTFALAGAKNWQTLAGLRFIVGLCEFCGRCRVTLFKVAKIAALTTSRSGLLAGLVLAARFMVQQGECQRLFETKRLANRQRELGKRSALLQLSVQGTLARRIQLMP